MGSTLPVNYDPASQAFVQGQQLFTPAQTVGTQDVSADVSSTPTPPVAPQAAPIPAPTPAPTTAPEPPTEPQAIGRQEEVKVEAPKEPPPSPAAPDPEDALYEQILNMSLNDMFGEQYVSQLQEQAAGGMKKLRPGMTGKQKFEVIAGAVGRGIQASVNPDIYKAEMAREAGMQEDAVKTLASMQGQLNTYKREAIRQRSAERRATAGAEAIANRTLAREMMSEMNKVQTEATALGIALPERPNWKELTADPDLGTTWMSNASSAMAPKKSGMLLLQNQLPLFLKSAQNVNAAPGAGAMEKMWRASVLANGFSMDDYVRMFQPHGALLESESANARAMNTARITKINAQVDSLRNDDSLARSHEARLAEAMQHNDEFKATMALRDLEALQFRVRHEYETHALLGTSSIDPVTMKPFEDDQRRLDVEATTKAYTSALMNQMTNLDQGISKWRTQLFQKFGRDINQVMMDSSQRIMQKNAQQIQAGFAAAAAKNPNLTLDTYLTTNDPPARKFRQDLLSEILLTQPPSKVQAMVDTVGVDMLKSLEEQRHFTAAELAQMAATGAQQAPAPKTAPAAGLPRQ